MGVVTQNFFIELFTTKSISAYSSHLLFVTATSIFEEDNLMLIVNFIMEEIVKALKSMGPTKGPSIDGFPVIFFQRY